MSQKIFIGIQSRLNSIRFPQKATKLIANKPLIIRVLERMSTLQHPHTIALLVPYNETTIFTNLLQQYKINIPVFGGEETNVLSRYYHAANHFEATDLIMRVTGDNPLISIPLADLLIEYHHKHSCDLSHYLKNPLGTGVEIINFKALEKSYLEAQEIDELEHVTQYIYKNSSLFHIEEPISPYIIEKHPNLSVDYPKDVLLIENLLKIHSNWDISLFL